MATFEIAHIREQGVDLIIVPLEPAFGWKPEQDQADVIASIQYHAHSAGLAGTVVPVWRDGSSYCFIAPSEWHPFFTSLGWNDILVNINKRLTCD